jgi:phosphoglycerate dehydrogenase-like enzyme
MPDILIDVDVHQPSLERLRAIKGVKVFLVPEPMEKVRPLPIDLIADAEILLCTYPPENHTEMKRLRWLQITSAGYNQLYGLRLVERGIRAANGRGNFDIPIAEWNIAMMINLARDLRQMIRNQDHAVWDRDARFQQEIRGNTLGIWGYGGIGRETARLAKAMGLVVHVLSRKGVGPIGDIYTAPGTGDPQGILPDRVYVSGQEHEFLHGLDFLVLSIPLTPATEGIMGKPELQALPRTAFLLNPSRGPLVQEQPLIEALTEGWIAGAALDTHYHYPMPPEHPLWRMPNVIFTPHISGSGLSPHFLERTWDILIENVKRDVAGRPLMNELTSAQINGA